MMTVRRWLKRLLIAALVLLVALGVWGTLTVRSSFPLVSGTVALPGLDDEVTVVRDAVGVPHIYATSAHDLFAAQGYVHAQDRFFQMDFWRHIGAARLSEMFGPASVETDRFLRTLRLEPTAVEEYAALEPEHRQILDAYAEGVNAYLADHDGAQLSLEYAVLGLTNRSYEPEPWTPTNTLTWAKMMSWDLGSNMDYELARALTAGAVGVDMTEELWPPYPTDQPVIAPSGSTNAAATPTPTATPGREALAELNRTISDVRRLTGTSGVGIGSNNWVVSGSKTATGLPILANDPHLSIQMPSIWYQVGLHCQPVGEECPFNVAGFSFAGTPGVVIGHNDRIAWGVTNLAPDTQDLVVEKINPDNPRQYEVDGEWIDMEVYSEEIVVAGGDNETLEILWTRNGPLITDTFGGLEDFDTSTGGITVPDTFGVALRWTSLQPVQLVGAIVDLNKAQDWDSFREALSRWDTAAQNVVYADVDGNIGYQATGLTPIRADGDGRWPVPGWTKQYDWVDTVPFDALPFVYNPGRGFIVTANHAVVDSGYDYLLTTDWAYGYRAERIEEVLGQSDNMTVEFMNELQNDARNVHAGELLPLLLEVPAESEAAAAVQATMRSWAEFGTDLFAPKLQNGIDSAGAAAYNATWRHLLLRLVDELDSEEVPLDGGSRMFVAVNNLARDPGNAWWDIVGTTPVEQRDDILILAMEDAYEELVDIFGDEPEAWRWGDIHTAEFRNGTFGESGIAPIEALFNRGPYAVGGGPAIVNAMHWSPADGYQVVAIPSMRMVVDMSNFDGSTAIHSTGQSGHAFHPHYIDMADAWAAGATNPMVWSEAEALANPEGVLIFAP